MTILLISLFIIILIAVTVKNSRTRFTGSGNSGNDIEKITTTSKETHLLYQDGIFSYSDNVFTIRIDGQAKKISWEEILIIKAYKIDRVAFDSIVIEIHLSNTFITVNDETPGYMKFMEIASDRLANFRKDWFSAVAFPPFETNLITIFQRQAGTMTTNIE